MSFHKNYTIPRYLCRKMQSAVWYFKNTESPGDVRNSAVFSLAADKLGRQTS